MSREAQQIVHQLREDGLSDEEIVWYAVNMHDADEDEIRSELQQGAPAQNSAAGQSSARGDLQPPSEWTAPSGGGRADTRGRGATGSRGKAAKTVIALVGLTAVVAVGGVLFHGNALDTLLGNKERTTDADDYVGSESAPRSAHGSSDEAAAMLQRAIDAWYWKYEDSESVYRLFREAAEQGDAVARAELAKMYWHGAGVTQDETRAGELAREALPELRRRAEAGEPHAQLLLGWYYGQDGLVFEQDIEKEMEWYRRAALQGYAPAQTYLAVSYFFGDYDGDTPDYALAEKWYRKAAEQGYPEAEAGLGEIYHSGWDVVPQNEARAAEWYLKAAEKGVADAQSILGYMYEEGAGVPKNYGEAIKWHRAIAEQGHLPSQNHLGELYEDERIIGKDLDAAVTWYRKSARQGYEPAQENLRRLNLDW